MPYDPPTTNRAGEILGKYMVGAAEAEAKGIVGSAESIASGITDLGKGVGSGISKFADQQYNNKQRSDYLDTSYESQKKMGVPWSAEDDSKWYKSNLAQKEAMKTSGDMMLEDIRYENRATGNLNRGMQGDYWKRHLEQQQQNAERATIGDPVTGYDVNGNPVTMTKTSAGQATTILPPAQKPPPRPLPATDGYWEFNPKTGRYDVPMVDAKGNRIMPPAAQQVDPLFGPYGGTAAPAPPPAAPPGGAAPPPPASTGGSAPPAAGPTSPGGGFNLSTPPPTLSGASAPGLGAAPAGNYPTPTADSIAALRANPSMAAEYDKFYGPGAAARALGGR